MDSFTLPQGELRAEFTSFAGFEPAWGVCGEFEQRPHAQNRLASKRRSRRVGQPRPRATATC